MDLDDEELKATRMMNGADRKGRVNKMEQDIKIILNVIYDKNENQMNYIDIDNITPDKECKTFITAIEHLIKAYKELEEYYEEQNEVNAKFIPVSLVEEKILNPMKEEHDKAIKGFIKRDIPQCIEDGGIAQELGYFIGKIEELLEKRK